MSPNDWKFDYLLFLNRDCFISDQGAQLGHSFGSPSSTPSRRSRDHYGGAYFHIHARDELHRHSKVSAAATAVICGLGPYGYVRGDGWRG
jgi:hypothetical protein